MFVVLIALGTFLLGLSIGAVAGIAAGEDDDSSKVAATNEEDLRDVEPGNPAPEADPPATEPTDVPSAEPAEPTEHTEPTGEPDSGNQVLEGWEILGKVDIRPDSLDDFEAVFRAVNTTDGPLMAAFDMTVLKGDEILATLTCGDYDEIAPGRTTTFECTTTDDFQRGWDNVELEYGGF